MEFPARNVDGGLAVGRALRRRVVDALRARPAREVVARVHGRLSGTNGAGSGAPRRSGTRTRPAVTTGGASPPPAPPAPRNTLASRGAAVRRRRRGSRRLLISQVLAAALRVQPAVARILRRQAGRWREAHREPGGRRLLALRRRGDRGRKEPRDVAARAALCLRARRRPPPTQLAAVARALRRTHLLATPMLRSSYEQSLKDPQSLKKRRRRTTTAAAADFTPRLPASASEAELFTSLHRTDSEVELDEQKNARSLW